MPPLPESVGIAFEQFVQALPEDHEAMACEFRVFARSRKINSPLQLLQVVMLYCGEEEVQLMRLTRCAVEYCLMLQN